MEVKRAVVRPGDVGRKVVNASVPRARIRKTHFGEYVTYAEQQGWHTSSTITSRARSQPWYDLGIRPKSERADFFWPKSQQYRHVVPLNQDLLPANSNLYDVWARDNEQKDLLWAVLNSTIAALAKHQFGRAAGVEGALKTEVVDVNMMLVPDIRKAQTDAAARAVAACQRMSRRNAQQHLYDEFELEDRRELDDATLEILGIGDAQQRTELREKIYRDIKDLQRSTREREVIAQRDRIRANRRTQTTPQDIADELWAEHEPTIDLQQFPEDFVKQPNEGELFDLPPGEVQVGTAMMGGGSLLRAGTIRVGGPAGEIIDAGTVSKSRFLQAIALCYRSGIVKLPSDEVCDRAVNDFNQYRQDLESRFTDLASQRTFDQQRQKAVFNALIRRAMQWRRE